MQTPINMPSTLKLEIDLTDEQFFKLCDAMRRHSDVRLEDLFFGAFLGQASDPAMLWIGSLRWD